jgi:hypothetical protein
MSAWSNPKLVARIERITVQLAAAQNAIATGDGPQPDASTTTQQRFMCVVKQDIPAGEELENPPAQVPRVDVTPVFYLPTDAPLSGMVVPLGYTAVRTSRSSTSSALVATSLSITDTPVRYRRQGRPRKLARATRRLFHTIPVL